MPKIGPDFSRFHYESHLSKVYRRDTRAHRHKTRVYRPVFRKITFSILYLSNAYNRLGLVLAHFMSCDPISLDNTSFDLSNMFHNMQSCAIGANSSTILKLSIIMVT